MIPASAFGVTLFARAALDVVAAACVVLRRFRSAAAERRRIVTHVVLVLDAVAAVGRVVSVTPYSVR
jgi:hypothetical protein